MPTFPSRMPAEGGVTNEVMRQLERLYADLDRFVKLVGLEYVVEDDFEGYVCTNMDEVDPNWCDDEMLASIENAHTDLGYFLGR